MYTLYKDIPRNESNNKVILRAPSASFLNNLEHESYPLDRLQACWSI